MGNPLSKKRTKLKDTAEDADPPVAQDSSVSEAATQIEGDNTTKSDKPKKKKEKVKKEKVKKEKVKKEKPKKEKSKKEKKKKDKKEKKKSKGKAEYTEIQVTSISDGTNSVDVTNFNGDTQNLEDAVTISITIETSDSESSSMRGKENARPVTVYEGRPASPKGPGVSALREKFGAKATGTPVRPVSYPASRLQNESPKSELHQPVHRKSFGFNRLEETPQKQTSKNGNADGNVSALKQKFGGTHAGSPPSPKSPTTKQTLSFATPTPKVAATPSKFGGVANKWQPKQNNTPSETKTPARSNVEHTVTPTTTATTTTTTTGISALRNRFKSNSDDRTSAKPTGQTSISPDKKRRKAEEEKRAVEQVQKENEKNRSPRRWSPKKESKTPSREASPTKDASPRKRKSVVLNRWNGITRSKSKHDNKDEVEESPLIDNKTVDNKAEEAEKEKARQLIADRTSALIHGSNATPKTTTPSRVQFEESVPKRTRRDERTKERPKTEYNFQSVQTPRPKSIADTNQLFSSPGDLSNMTPVKGTNIIKNPTTKTQKLLQWCQIHTQGYDGVCVKNFSSSWADGLAFCALVHKFFPSAIRFNTLSSSNRRHNFDLAFSSAEKCAKVPQLLDTDDMIEMGDKPDWKCVFTYVTSLYAGLNKHGI